MTPFTLKNSRAIITGASRGIGAAIALELAKKGCNLALSDLSVEMLSTTARDARALGVEVTEHALDVSDPSAIKVFAKSIIEMHPDTNLLINNAGISLIGSFLSASEEQFEKVMNINFWGTVNMTRAFLSHFRSLPQAHIVNLSSLFGIVGPILQTAYASSKFAVRGFSETLLHELEHTEVGVTVVHPGGIKTALVQNSLFAPTMQEDKQMKMKKSFDKMALTTPEVTAALIVSGIENRKKRLLIGIDAKLITMLSRLFPVLYWKLLTFFQGKKVDTSS
ncbi:MAG: SDR family NAD(P)-dependent oxidoreductase [Betaproteobacteria bacterium]|jgi:short-subunit dehydrogenase